MIHAEDRGSKKKTVSDPHVRAVLANPASARAMAIGRANSRPAQLRAVCD